jgi:hypothetical protein
VAPRAAAKIPDAFQRELVPGRNSLAIRAVNQAGVAGPASQIDITYYPPSL